MSYYNTSSYGHQSSASSGGLQFLPTQFGTPQTVPSAQGMMSNQPATSYSYGDNSREPLSTGILAAFGTQGYPDEPPLLEGMNH